MKSNKDLNKIKKDVDRQERRWEIERDILLRKQKMSDEKKEIKKKIKGRPMAMSKLLIIFLFGSLTLIEIFTGWATIKMLSVALVTGMGFDFTPLVTLIGAVAGEVVGYAIYSLKSLKENSSGGIIYEQAMREPIIQQEPQESLIE